MIPYAAGAQAASGALDMVRQVANAIKQTDKALGGTSLIDITQSARVEPLLLVDADLMNLEYMPEVAQTMQNLFAGYYLQAIEIITNVGGVKVADRLAPLNPNRKVDVGLLSHDDWRMKSESYTHALPTNKNKKRVAVESQSVQYASEILTIKSKRVALEDQTDVKEITDILTDATPLSVGKLYDITIKEGAESAKIKIAIRVMAKSLPTSTMVRILSNNNVQDMDMKERYHGWKSGRLSFWKDLVMCQDLIEAHRNAAIRDKTNTYSEILNRETDSWMAGLIHGDPSVGMASNLVVISNNTLDQIEAKMLGSIENQKVRREIFNTGNIMILAVVDKGFDRVTFYHRGINQSSEMSVRDMAQSNKGKGPDVTDILKAFIGGSAPAL